MNINTSFKTIRNAMAHAVIGGLFIAPLVAHAQAGAPAKNAPAAATPAAATPATPAPVAVTPEARAAIKELLDVMNTRDGLTKTYGAMSQSLAPRMGEAMNRQIEANAALSVEQKQKVRDGMNPPFENAVKEATAIVTSPKLVDETIEKMIPIYAKYFTTAEAKQLTAFYKTPLGAKTLTAMPQVINDSLQAGVAIFTPRVNAIMEKTMKTQMDAVSAAPAPAKK